MEFESYLRFGLALVLVVGLIGLAAWVARRFGLAGPAMLRGRARRLAVIESTGIDAKRRLVLVRRDGTEHLLLLGPAGSPADRAGMRAGDVVVESDIAAQDKPAAAAPAEAAQ